MSIERDGQCDCGLIDPDDDHVCPEPLKPAAVRLAKSTRAKHCTQCGKLREIVGSCHHCGGEFCEDCCGLDCCDEMMDECETEEDDENDLLDDLNDDDFDDDEEDVMDDGGDSN